MEYRTLENTDSVCIYEAFTQAFSDYQVSVDMPFKSFETMLKRNGFMPAVSVGAFADRTLVGFILNGVRDWDNEKTVYDLGTGVIPDFRRTGIMGELLNLVRTICIKNKISVYQLEVIQDNEKALTLYKKQGFRINRILNCYQLTGKIKEPGVYKVWKLEHPEKLQDDQWTAVKDFWSYPPSWQNAKDAVCAIAKSFTDSNLNHTGIYLYSKGKIMIHLTFDYKTDEKCTTPGQYLKYHRTFQGLSTRELAEKVGIVPATLVLYENDRHPIKHSTAVALANALGIDRNRLLDKYTAFVDYPYSSLLKKVRQDLSLTQIQMAELIGIGQTSYSGWEREIRVPRRKEYDKILAALEKLRVNVDTYLCQSASI